MIRPSSPAGRMTPLVGAVVGGHCAPVRGERAWAACSSGGRSPTGRIPVEGIQNELDAALSSLVGEWEDLGGLLCAAAVSDAFRAAISLDPIFVPTSLTVHLPTLKPKHASRRAHRVTSSWRRRGIPRFCPIRFLVSFRPARNALCLRHCVKSVRFVTLAQNYF